MRPGPEPLTAESTALRKSLNWRIFSAALVVSLLTLGSKIVSMVKEMVGAAWFGTGDEMDAFLMAFTLPAFLTTVVSSSLHAALIPTQVEVREKEGKDAAQRTFSSAVTLSGVLLLAACALLAYSGPVLLPVLCTGFAPQKLNLTLELFFILLPSLVLAGLSANWESLLNANERFALVALAPALVPLTMVGCLLAFGKSLGIYALAVGTLAGFLFQLTVLGIGLRRLGVALIPRWYGLDGHLKGMIKQYLPALASSTLMGMSVLVDQTMASALPAGSVATLGYGNKLFSLVSGLGTMALSTAVLPYFSKMVAIGDWPGIRHTLWVYIRLILAVSIPAVAGAVFFATPIVDLLFRRGNFTAADSQLVSGVQSMLMLQLPFYSLAILFVRMISSLKANHILFWGTLINVTLNVTLNYLLMKRMGVAGIALSTTLVYVASCLFLGGMLHGSLKKVQKVCA